MDNRKEILALVKSAVLEADSKAEVILFGSRARNDSSNASDWDFLILTENEATGVLKKKVRQRLYDVELETDQVISSVIYSKKNWDNFKITPLYHAIQNDGVLI